MCVNTVTCDHNNIDRQRCRSIAILVDNSHDEHSFGAMWLKCAENFSPHPGVHISHVPTTDVSGRNKYRYIFHATHMPHTPPSLTTYTTHHGLESKRNYPLRKTMTPRREMSHQHRTKSEYSASVGETYVLVYRYNNLGCLCLQFT